MYYKFLAEKQIQINQTISQLEERIKTLPSGKLICSKNGSRTKWYNSLEGKYFYIPKKERFLAEQLAIKKYLLFKIEDLEREKKAIQLLSQYFKTLSEELEEWKEAPYKRNERHPEGLIHKSVSGNLLRSKSEVLVDMVLYQNKIPYRYECELVLGNITLYPDFTIRHPETGQIYYYEHFGMMDNPAYVQNYLKKMRIYTENGIIPTVNLIATYETKEHPLTIEKVEKLFADYFL